MVESIKTLRMEGGPSLGIFPSPLISILTEESNPNVLVQAFHHVPEFTFTLAPCPLSFVESVYESTIVHADPSKEIPVTPTSRRRSKKLDI